MRYVFHIQLTYPLKAIIRLLVSRLYFPYLQTGLSLLITNAARKRIKISPISGSVPTTAAQEFGAEWLDWPAPQLDIQKAQQFIRDMYAVMQIDKLLLKGFLTLNLAAVQRHK
jgi:hypothetical protein